MPRIATLLATLTCLVSLHTGAADDPADDRAAAYRQYREAFDAGEYARALPLAVRVAELTGNQFGAEAPELANPLTNLATTLYRLGEHGEALDTYRRALTIIDLQGNATDPRLVAPLHGIGLALRGLQRDAEAIVPLKRAVDIVRNRDGLHAAGQLPMLRALISSYERAGLRDDANREHLYAFNVAEQSWGRDDPRLLPLIAELARWYESTGRYTAARVLHLRAVQIADRESPGSVKAVEPLRGVARTFRLAYVFGEPQDTIMAVPGELPPSLGPMAMAGMSSALTTEGERALRSALQRLENAGGGRNAERGAVLIDLGDWYRIAGVGARAMASWRDAWQALAAAGDTSALEQPAAVIYRPPQMVVSTRRLSADEYAIREIELRLSIAADGEVREATVANPSPQTESVERSLTSAVRRATWRPAFAGGIPVAATSFTFREQVYVRLSELQDAG